MTRTQKPTVLARFAVVGLILVTMAIYLPPYIRSFVGDDYIQFDYVKPFLQNPATILQAFNPTAVGWYYRPLQNIWFWLNRLVLGWEPTGYYLILLWFHALAIALMFRVARQFRLRLFAAFCTAVLFAIHSHWVDVVSWISSVAIVMAAVFSLLAISGLLSYVASPSTRQLSLVFLITLLTFLTHEEAFLLPPFLFLLLLMTRWEKRRLEIGDRRLKKPRHKSPHHLITSSPHHPITSSPHHLITKQELFYFGLLFLITIIYLVIQFTRPNPTVQAAERPLSEWLAYLGWPKVAEFVLVTAFRFSFVYPVLHLTGFAANLFVVGLGILLVVWFWKGNWVIRFGLLWTVAHLFFIYWALWSQLPTLYAGRHIYQAGIGLALALGGTIERVIGNWVIGHWKVKNYQLPITQLLILVLLTAVTLHHLHHTRRGQQQWLENVTEEEIAKAQLFHLIPQITEKNHIFSYRFSIAPRFTRSVMQVWYDVWLARPGGDLEQLANHGRATPDFIVLDDEEGQVYNLMPELAEHDETIFLWTEQLAEMTAVNRRLALPITPVNGEWTGTTVQVEVPEGAVLRTAVYQQANTTYRIQLTSENGETITVFESQDAGEEDHWLEVEIPLTAYAGETVTIGLEAMTDANTETTAYFANPRLTVDH
jgi:hypothetical protein